MLSSDTFFDDQATRTLGHTLYGGADFGECITTMQRVPAGDMQAWYREWIVTADRVAAIAATCASAGHDVSAREAYLRASNYYRTAYLMLFGAPTSADLVKAYERESATFREFASRMDPALEPVEIPYEGTSLPAYFCPAPGVAGKAPVVIANGGYDSTMHEQYFGFAVAANRRGYHCLLFDGPGQGRPLIQQGLPTRPDWENVIRPVIDYLLTRLDVDHSKMVLAGWSLGGYQALRGAGGERRLAACVADPGLMGLWTLTKKMFPGLPPEVLERPREADPALFEPYMAQINASPVLHWKVVQRAFWVHGVSSLAEYVAAAREFDNRPILPSISCPVFLAQEENDPLAATAPDVFDALPGRKQLTHFLASEGADGHCAVMGRSLFHQRMFDWLDEVLCC